MAKKKASSGKAKFDFKQFMLAKGEKIAMIVAGVGLALLALLGVMQATRADSPGTITSKLKEGAQSIDTRLAQTEGQVPDKIQLPEGNNVYVTVGPFDYPTDNEWFSPASNIVEKRVNPQLLAAIEGRASFARGGVGVFDIQGNSIAVIENRNQAMSNVRQIDRFRKKGGQSKAPPPPPPSTPQPPVASQPPIPAPTPGAGATGGRGGAGGAQNVRTGEPEIQYMDLDSASLEKAVLALNLAPTRMAVIEGVVPYKAQVEKYLRALRLENDAALEADGSAPSYRGMNIERQVLDADGKTVINDWATFDHITSVADLYRLTAEFVTEDKIKDLIPDPSQRLYMKKPKFVRGNYEASNLNELAKALQELEKTGPPKTLGQRGNKFQGQLDPFNPDDISRGGGAGPAGQPGNLPPEGKMGGIIPRNEGPRGGAGPAMTTQQQRNNAAPVWKLQFIDPTIEPGKCYRYRVQLKADNPNRGKKDLVAIPSAASVDEIVSDWFEIPDVVVAPPEEHLYARGERYLDPSQIGSAAYDTTLLEFHRWFDTIRVTRSSSRTDPIGEWVVAGIEAKRGQYVSQERGFKLPIWSMVHGTYLFRDFINGEKPKNMAQYLRRENVKVTFSPNEGRVMLVDFEGGKGIHRLPNGQTTVDESMSEVLLVNDDGKTMMMTARNTATDKNDQERLARERAWEQWLNDVENAGKNAQNAGGAGGPLPKGG